MSDQNWDAAKLGGSMKRGIVNPDLLEERAKRAFDVDELVKFNMGEIRYNKYLEMVELYKKYPEFCGTAEEYEMTREEQMERGWKKIKLVNEVTGDWIS